MIDNELIANSLVNAFITGKHFNRCKIIYTTMSLGLQIFHFKEFLDDSNIEVSDYVNQYLENFRKT